MIYKPTVQYFKTLFPIFSYTKENSPAPLGVVSEDFLLEQIEGVSEEVRAKMREDGYTEPTKENGMPFINLKNYICMKVADTLRYQYAGEAVVLHNIREKMKSLEDEYHKDLKRITSLSKDSEAFTLHGGKIIQ